LQVVFMPDDKINAFAAPNVQQGKMVVKLVGNYHPTPQQGNVSGGFVVGCFAIADMNLGG
ncbi:MAG: hypothetical protein N2747_11605, partial [Chitinophagaceae bacterium]|nr:hypothetical protein [Chitinophagaceae bacterium]